MRVPVNYRRKNEFFGLFASVLDSIERRFCFTFRIKLFKRLQISLRYYCYGRFKVARLSKNQRKILELLSIKPEMSTKEIAELLFLKAVKYKSKEYSSVHRSLISLEKQKCIHRIQAQLRWRLAPSLPETPK